MIYFIQAMCPDGPQPIKIGFTSDRTAEARLAGLQTGSPWPLVILREMTGTLQDERKLHERFAAHRMNGEWFHPTEEILATARYGTEDAYWKLYVLCRSTEPEVQDFILDIMRRPRAAHECMFDLVSKLREAQQAGSQEEAANRCKEAMALFNVLANDIVWRKPSLADWERAVNGTSKFAGAA